VSIFASPVLMSVSISKFDSLIATPSGRETVKKLM
jgi:hypothetical protein